MLTFGQDLYVPTSRDAQTLQLEPWFRVVQGTVAAAADTATVSLPIPPDRCLYVQQLQIALNGAALSTWNYASVALNDAIGNFMGGLFTVGDQTGTLPTLIGEACATSGAGIGVRLNRQIQFVLPPQLGAINLSVRRSVNTNAATFGLAVIGYLLPPGGIARA
jgi:hypothetical protein